MPGKIRLLREKLLTGRGHLPEIFQHRRVFFTVCLFPPLPWGKTIQLMKLTDKGRRCAEADLHADFGHGKILVIQKYTSPLNADSLYILKRRKSQKSHRCAWWHPTMPMTDDLYHAGEAERRCGAAHGQPTGNVAFFPPFRG